MKDFYVLLCLAFLTCFRKVRQGSAKYEARHTKKRARQWNCTHAIANLNSIKQPSWIGRSTRMLLYKLNRNILLLLKTLNMWYLPQWRLKFDSLKRAMARATFREWLILASSKLLYMIVYARNSWSGICNPLDHMDSMWDLNDSMDLLR